MKITGFWKHLFSRLLGSKDQYRAKRCASTTIWLSMIAGIICVVISVIFLEKIALSMGADTNTLPSVKRYMLFYGIGAPFIVANFTLEQMIRGEGESVQSMIGMMISVGVNIVLDPIFMFGFKFGIGGAAIATVLGNLAAVIYYIICIPREGKQLSVSFADFKIELAMLKEIFSVGFSAMILAVIMSVVRGLILIPVIIVGNWLFQLNGVIFSLLVAEAVSCITGCVIYYLIRNK